MSATTGPLPITSRSFKLPLADRSVAELITVLNKPISNFSQVVERLSPEVAARFLDMANTVQSDREVSSLNYAVQLLGYGQMKRILISSILIDHFNRNLPDFDFVRFQTQSLFCAVLSRIIGKIVDYDRPEDLFTAGVLHNIGKQIIAVHFQEAHRRILKLKSEEPLTTSEAVHRVLGITHAEIGAATLARFNIPRPICEAVRLHNVDTDVLPRYPEGALCRIVHTASRVISRFSLPEGALARTLERRLQTDIELRREDHKAAVAEAVRTTGYDKAFPRLLRSIGSGLASDLGRIMRPRSDVGPS